MAHIHRPFARGCGGEPPCGAVRAPVPAPGRAQRRACGADAEELELDSDEEKEAAKAKGKKKSAKKSANRISDNFVNGFDIVPRASVLAAKHVLKDLLALQMDESTLEQSAARPAAPARVRTRLSAVAALLIRDANRTRRCSQCSPATQVQIVQNGEPTVRYTDDLKPLNFYHLERGSTWDSVIVTKKPGSELERIDLTRQGLISDHIAGRYVSRLRVAQVQQSFDQERRTRPASLRPGLRRRKLVPPLRVAPSR